MAGDTDYAAALEAEALGYPEQRGEILLEAAEAWLEAGELERSTGLLRDLVDGGGEDACYALVELAAVHLDSGSYAEAQKHLAQLARHPALHDGHCQLAAELLVDHGDLNEALTWYDRLVTRLTEEQIEEVRGPDGWAAHAAISLRGRRGVREELGLPPDATDEIVPMVPPDRTTSLEDLDADLASGREAPRGLRILTFQRADRAEITRRWPGELDESDEEYYPAAERRWRQLADAGVPTIRLVAPTVAELEAFAAEIGGSLTDAEIRSRYADIAPDEKTMAWPPSRNAPCWCGSGGKYKKCCGRPGS